MVQDLERPHQFPGVRRIQRSSKASGLSPAHCLQNKHLRTSVSSPIKWECYRYPAVFQKPSMTQNEWFCCRARAQLGKGERG